jgi:hypothetical protein
MHTAPPAGGLPTFSGRQYAGSHICYTHTSASMPADTFTTAPPCRPPHLLRWAVCWVHDGLVRLVVGSPSEVYRCAQVHQHKAQPVTGQDEVGGLDVTVDQARSVECLGGGGEGSGASVVWWCSDTDMHASTPSHRRPAGTVVSAVSMSAVSMSDLCD